MKDLEGFISSNIVDVTAEDRIFCYAWKFKTNELPGIKFGDTYVEKGQSGRKEVVNRIYESLSVLKNATVGHIQLCHYWDVTEYVKNDSRKVVKLTIIFDVILFILVLAIVAMSMICQKMNLSNLYIM